MCHLVLHPVITFVACFLFWPDPGFGVVRVSRPWPRHYDDKLMSIDQEPSNWDRVAREMDRTIEELQERWCVLRRHVRRLRRPDKKLRYTKVTPEEHRTMCEQFVAGEKMEYIAALHDVTLSTVERHVRREGLSRERVRADRNDSRWQRAVSNGPVLA